MRASRTVRDALADCPRLNSNGKIAKSTTGAAARWAGRTVRQGHADRPRAGRGLSALDPEQHLVLLRITDRPPVLADCPSCPADRPPGPRGPSSRKRIFLKTFAKNSGIK
jgi:hypothetical protein